MNRGPRTSANRTSARAAAYRWAALALLALSAHATPGHALMIGRTGVYDESLVADVAEEVLTEASRRSGIAFEFKRLPALRSIEMANDGDLDGDLARPFDVVARYPDLLAVPTPISRFTVGVFASSRDILTKDRATIRHMRVGVMRGIFSVAKHSQGLDVTQTHSSPSTLEALSTGRFDVALLEYTDTVRQLETHHVTGIYWWPHAWAVEPLHLLLHKKHAALVPRLDRALQEMAREGLIERTFDNALHKHHIEPLTSEEPAPRR